MKRIFRETIARWATAGLFIFLGVGLCWRAWNYANPTDPTMLAPMMCVILALVLTMTGLILAMRGSDLEGTERQPARQN
jgi:hypothetical protein